MNPSFRWLSITTVALIILVVLIHLEAPLLGILITGLIGQGLLVFTVVQVLKDKQDEPGTFSQGYRDRRIDGLE